MFKLLKDEEISQNYVIRIGELHIVLAMQALFLALKASVTNLTTSSLNISLCTIK